MVDESLVYARKAAGYLPGAQLAIVVQRILKAALDIGERSVRVLIGNVLGYQHERSIVAVQVEHVGLGRTDFPKQLLSVAAEFPDNDGFHVGDIAVADRPDVEILKDFVGRHVGLAETALPHVHLDPRQLP